MSLVDRSTEKTGFTLLEVVIVLAVISILLAVSAPNYAQWVETGNYRKTAREFASSLREARSRAVSRNLEHRVEFDLDIGAFRMTHGNRPTNSTASSWNNNVVCGWIDLPPGQIVRANEPCDIQTGTVDIHLNPDGSGESQYVCLFDEKENPRFQIGIPHAATGQVVIRHWNRNGNAWE